MTIEKHAATDKWRGNMEKLKICVGRCVALVALLILPFIAQAEDARQETLRAMHHSMFLQHELCVLYARAALSPEKSDAADKLTACIAEGKSDVEEANANLAKLLKGRSAHAALARWRIAWLAAYDAADLRANDTTETYLRRAIDTLDRTDKASDKFTAAVLKSPLY